jgi:hypothetical protein
MAQEFRATLQGTVTDPTRIVIPAAQASLRNRQTGLERTTAADRRGHYLFQFLPPGVYTLTVHAAGFRTAAREDIFLSLNSNVRLDVQMTIGLTLQTVLVTADAALVQAESSSLGAVVPEAVSATLPLKGHSSLLMFNLAPGVVSDRYGEDTRPANTVQNVLYSASGSPPASGDVSVDGVSNTVNVNRGTNISAVTPATCPPRSCAPATSPRLPARSTTLLPCISRTVSRCARRFPATSSPSPRRTPPAVASSISTPGPMRPIPRAPTPGCKPRSSPRSGRAITAPSSPSSTTPRPITRRFSASIKEMHTWFTLTSSTASPLPAAPSSTGPISASP